MSLGDQSQQWLTARAKVSVLQARGLRIKGKLGTDGAHVLLQVGSQKFSTPKGQQQRADPVWEGQEAAFELAGFPENSAALRVQVLQRALVGPDKLLGQTDIDLGELYSNRGRDRTEWFKLFGKPGKPEKDRGEVLLDIQFLKGSMSASMFDLSSQDKSRSKIGKLKDKLRGKKKEGLSDSASAIVPSVTQVMTDSEGEEEEEPAAGEKKKKNKLKSLFVPKSSLQRNTSQSMSTLSPFPERDSAIASSSSSGLNMESPEGKKKFKLFTHKRNSSTDSKVSQSGFVSKQSGPPMVCINGSHVYSEEPETKGSSLSLTSSGHGSMEELRREKEERERLEEERRRAEREVEEERRKIEEERKRKEREKEEKRKIEEEKERIRMEREKEEQRRKIEEERKRKEREEEEQRKIEEKERMRVEREKEEQRRKNEEERKRKEREEEEQRKLVEEKERMRVEREKEEQRRKIEEERKRKEREEEEQRKIEEEKGRMRMEREKEEQRRKIEEERKRKEREEEERRKIEEEKERMRMQREKEEQRKIEEERKRKEREAEEQKRKLEEEVERERKRVEEERRLAEEKRKRTEEEERLREEERKKMAMERRLAEEKKVREEEGRRRRVAEAEEAEKRRREAEEKRVREEGERERKRRDEEERRAREEEERKEKQKLRMEEEKRNMEMKEEEEKQQKKEREVKEAEQEKRPIPKARSGKVGSAAELPSEDTFSTNPFELSFSEEPSSTNPFEEPTDSQHSASVCSARVSAVKPSVSTSGTVSQLSNTNPFLDDDDSGDGSLENLSSVGRSTARKKRAPLPPQNKPEMSRPTVPSSDFPLEETKQFPKEVPKRPAPLPPGSLKKTTEEPVKESTVALGHGEKETLAVLENTQTSKVAPISKDELKAWCIQSMKARQGQNSSPQKMDPNNNQATIGQIGQNESTKKQADPILSTCGGGTVATRHNKGPAPAKPPAASSRKSLSGDELSSHSTSLTGGTGHPEEKAYVSTNSESKDNPSNLTAVEGPKSLVAEGTKPEVADELSHKDTAAEPLQNSYTDSLPRGEEIVKHLSKMNEPESLELNAPSCADQDLCPESLVWDPDRPNMESEALTGNAKKKSRAPLPPAKPKGIGDPDSPNQQPSMSRTLEANLGHIPKSQSNKKDQDKAQDTASSIYPSVTASSSTFAPFAEEPEVMKACVSVSTASGSRALPCARVVPADAQSSAGEVKGAGGAPASVIRQHTVKPLNATDKQSDLRETNGKAAGASDSMQPKTEAAEAVGKGPYSQLTRAELISLVIRQQEQLSQRDSRITELEQYIDNLLVRVMEEHPSILMSINSMKKAV